MVADYGDFSDQELSDELTQVDKDIESCQKAIVSHRKQLNSAMEQREALLDIIKQRGQNRGWHK